jgi:epoxyqueuosine reductase
LLAEIAARRAEGQLAAEFYQERLAHYATVAREAWAAARTLIVLAVPAPQTRVTFHWDGRAQPVILPPTYADETRTRQGVRDLLGEILAPAGHDARLAVLPFKLLAVRSGLGAYGRNNLCYVAGMGTFHNLMAYYSDMPCPQDHWSEPRMLERCEDCQACRCHCPTGAIPDDRFLLRAERCLTFHNERLNDFPEWIDPAWHTCLYGCLRCQLACPEDRAFWAWAVDGAEFTEEETDLLLQAVPFEALPAATLAKLQHLDLDTNPPRGLARNLQACLCAGR